jgi:hypothetical protein
MNHDDSFKKRYHAYLQSAGWRWLVRQVKQRCEGICERCHVNDMADTHHLTYARVFHERLDDLLGVCRSCHEYLSGRSQFDPVKLRAGDLSQIWLVFKR